MSLLQRNINNQYYSSTLNYHPNIINYGMENNNELWIMVTYIDGSFIEWEIPHGITKIRILPDNEFVSVVKFKFLGTIPSGITMEIDNEVPIDIEIISSNKGLDDFKDCVFKGSRIASTGRGNIEFQIRGSDKSLPILTPYDYKEDIDRIYNFFDNNQLGEGVGISVVQYTGFNSKLFDIQKNDPPYWQKYNKICDKLCLY